MCTLITLYFNCMCSIIQTACHPISTYFVAVWPMYMYVYIDICDICTGRKINSAGQNINTRVCIDMCT